MKSVIFFIVLLFTISHCKADQMLYISKEMAVKATKYLKQQKEVILWCDRCTDEAKRVVKVTDIHYIISDLKDFWNVILEGVNKDGKKIIETIDLAYVWVNIKNKAVYLGKIYKFRDEVITFEWIK